MPVRLWIAVILSFALLTGCTQKSAENSQLVISLPKTAPLAKGQTAGALATSELFHLIINISGAGIAVPIIFNWDRHDNCQADPCPAAPTNFPFDVPSGSERLIQVLAVYGDPLTETMRFYYGDATKSLTAGVSESVPITVTSTGTAQTLIDGTISGRYFNASGVAPTGIVHIKYVPPGKPGMTIERSEMLAGWFNLFALNDTPLSYELADGTSLFGGPVSLQSPALNAASVLRVAVPQHYRYWGGGQYGEAEEESVIVVGYFGAVPQGKSACRPNSYTYSHRLTSLKGSPLRFPGSFTLSGANNTCSAGTEFVDYLSFSPELHDNNGKDAVAGFRPPFMKTAADHFVRYSDTAMSWSFLPGIDANVLDGVRVFARAYSPDETDDYRRNGEVRCRELLNLGFTQVGDVAYPNTSLDASTLSPFSTSGGVVLLCPYKGDRYHLSAMETHVGGGGGGTPAQIAVVKARQPYSATAENYCERFALELRDTNGHSTVSTSDLNFNLKMNGTEAVIYDNPWDCGENTAAVGPGLTLPANQDRLEFYLKTPFISDVSAVTLEVVDAGNSPALSPVNLSSLPLKSSLARTIVFDGPDRLYGDSCYPISLLFSSYQGYSVATTATTMLDFATGSGLQVFSDSACTSPTASAYISATASLTDVWVKLSSNVNSDTLTVTPSGGETFDSVSYTFYRGDGSNQISQLFMRLEQSSLVVNQCYGPYEARFANDFGVPMVLAVADSLELTSSGVTLELHVDNLCSAVYSSMPVSADNYRTQFYLKPTSTGAGTMTLSLGTVSATSNITVNP